MCTHDPACPPADAIDWWAARNVIERPGQGWTLLCNGALVFDDHGALLPDGRVAAISEVPRTLLCTVAERRKSYRPRRRQLPLSRAPQMLGAKRPDNPGNNARLRRSQPITEGGAHDATDTARHRHLRGGDRGRAPGCGQAAAVTAGLTDIAGHGMVNPPGNPGGGPDSFIGQMDYVFHELHADGRHALCGVCGNQ